MEISKYAWQKKCPRDSDLVAAADVIGVAPVPRPDSGEHFSEVVLRESGDGVLAAVDADGGAARDQEVELDVGRLGLVKLQSNNVG